MIGGASARTRGHHAKLTKLLEDAPRLLTTANLHPLRSLRLELLGASSGVLSFINSLPECPRCLQMLPDPMPYNIPADA